MSKNTIIIGIDERKAENVALSISRARACLICGKRGTGKSYTLGVLIEALNQIGGVIPIVIDPMGIFWTLAIENADPDLSKWGLLPTHFPVHILTVGKPEQRYGVEVVERMRQFGLQFKPLLLNPGDISPSEWCSLLELPIHEPQGIVLFRAVRSLKGFFTIDDIIKKVEGDPRAQDRTKEALLNRMEMVKNWDIFSDVHCEIWDLLDSRFITVLDLSTLDPGSYGLANLIVMVFLRDIFRERIKARRREDLGIAQTPKKIWLCIDEAHRFAPAGKSTLSKELLISWTKEGRHPGLSIVLATQQPSSLDPELLSQFDLIIAHRLTARADISALNRLSHAYIGELKNYMRNIKNQGEALILDDDEEKVSIVQVRQ